MNIASHLYLYRRNWIAILLITLIVLAATIVFTVVKIPDTHETTLFLSIGTKQTTESSTSFDDVQAADYFSETVQGWFKNPEFIERINAGTGISAKKQEKQNLIITFATYSEGNANKIADAVVSELKHEIQRYNTRTGSNFQLAIQSISVTEQNTKLVIFIVLGFILGLAIAIALSYLYEFTFGLTSYKHQVEKILKKRTDDVIAPSAIKKEELPLLKALHENLNHKNSLLVGINFEPIKIEDILTNGGPNSRKIESIVFPNDSAKLTKSYDENFIVACKLGKTKLQDLERIKSILPKNYLLVVLQ